MRNRNGVALIETLIALVVLAFAGAGMISLLAQTLNSVHGLHERERDTDLMLLACSRWWHRCRTRSSSPALASHERPRCGSASSSPLPRSSTSSSATCCTVRSCCTPRSTARTRSSDHRVTDAAPRLHAARVDADHGPVELRSWRSARLLLSTVVDTRTVIARRRRPRRLSPQRRANRSPPRRERRVGARFERVVRRQRIERRIHELVSCRTRVAGALSRHISARSSTGLHRARRALLGQRRSRIAATSGNRRVPVPRPRRRRHGVVRQLGLERPAPRRRFHRVEHRHRRVHFGRARGLTPACDMASRSSRCSGFFDDWRRRSGRRGARPRRIQRQREQNRARACLVASRRVCGRDQIRHWRLARTARRRAGRAGSPGARWTA